MKAFTIFSLALVLSFCLIGKTLSGQNLVPNPGFEIQDTCPAVSQLFLAPPWNSPTSNSPDLFNSTCLTQNSPGRTGIGSSGVYCYNMAPNNREYIQAPLISQLEAGRVYDVSFYVKRVNFRYATNQFGAYFSNGAISQSTTSNLDFTPQIQHPSSQMLSSSDWILISGSFTATGGESHIIIGSFASDANTDTLVANSSNSSKVAYYRIDDISVTKQLIQPEYYWLPMNGMVNVPVDQDITITFNSPMRMLNDDPISDPSSFIILRKDNSFGQDILFFSSISADKTTITINPVDNLEGLSMYYCEITAAIENEDDLPIASGSIVFQTVDNSGFMYSEREINSLFVYPNPCNSVSNLRFDLKNSGMVEWTLQNPVGKIIQHQSIGNCNPGEHEIQINTSKVEPGIYFLNLSINGKSEVVKINIQR